MCPYTNNKLFEKEIKEIILKRMPVAHAYNPSNSRGRDQEDPGLKPAQANSLKAPISKKKKKKKSQKKGWWSAQGIGPKFKPQRHTKKKRKKEKKTILCTIATKNKILSNKLNQRVERFIH
jgi:hypothetical protein